MAGFAEGVRPADDLLQLLRALAQSRVWDRVMAAVSHAYDGNAQMIDGTSVRVHQHAANSKSHPDRGMGGSRGGLTTKIHAVVDAEGMPI